MHSHLIVVGMAMQASLRLDTFFSSYPTGDVRPMYLAVKFRPWLNSARMFLHICSGTDPFGSILGTCGILHNEK
jgi:hypothetical protein